MTLRDCWIVNEIVHFQLFSSLLHRRSLRAAFLSLHQLLQFILIIFHAAKSLIILSISHRMREPVPGFCFFFRCRVTLPRRALCYDKIFMSFKCDNLRRQWRAHRRTKFHDSHRVEDAAFVMKSMLLHLSKVDIMMSSLNSCEISHQNSHVSSRAQV